MSKIKTSFVIENRSYLNENFFRRIENSLEIFNQTFSLFSSVCFFPRSILSHQMLFVKTFFIQNEVSVLKNQPLHKSWASGVNWMLSFSYNLIAADWGWVHEDEGERRDGKVPAQNKWWELKILWSNCKIFLTKIYPYRHLPWKLPKTKA